MKTDFFHAGFPTSHRDILETMSSQDTQTYYKAKEHILNFLSNDRFPHGASSKKFKS
jgi:hypothetical protein